MRRVTSVMLVVAGIVAMAFGGYLFFSYQPHQFSTPVLVTIPEQSGTEGALQALYDGGAIQSRSLLLLHLVLTRQRANIRAGTYTFSGSLSLAQIANMITRQVQLPDEIEVTLLEGWTNEQMAEALAQADIVPTDEFLTAAVMAKQHTQYEFLSTVTPGTTLQGFLFPDTYRFFRGDPASAIVVKLLETFDQKFSQELRRGAAEQNRSLYDVVTLASIVEKEVAGEEDRRIVAGIFWKRLDQNKALESDATINYITKKNTTTPDSVDLAIESAYNTYRNRGLPPTPITNPSLSALTATVQPSPSDYWFFLTTPQGEVIYSTTYEEHLAARSQYYE